MIVFKAVKPPKSIPDSAISTKLQMAAGLFTTAWESCIQIINDVTFDFKCGHIYFPRTLMKVIPKETLDHVVLK